MTGKTNKSTTEHPKARRRSKLRDDERQFVTALARGLEILRCFDSSRLELGSKEISELTGLPQPSVWRLCNTLVSLGYLVPTGGGRLRVGFGVLGLGTTALPSSDLGYLVEQEMQAIADATPGSVSLCVPDQFEMLILKRAMGSGALGFNHRVGARLPMVRSGAGLAYLAAIDEERLELVSAQLKEITADDWDKTQAMIAGARKMYRDYGFVLAEQIFHPDIRAVATPAEAKSGGRVFTLSCAGPIASREKLMKDIGPRLVALAKNIRSTSLMLT